MKYLIVIFRCTICFILNCCCLRVRQCRTPKLEFDKFRDGKHLPLFVAICAPSTKFVSPTFQRYCWPSNLIIKLERQLHLCLFVHQVPLYLVPHTDSEILMAIHLDNQAAMPKLEFDTFYDGKQNRYNN